MGAAQAGLAANFGESGKADRCWRLHGVTSCWVTRTLCLKGGAFPLDSSAGSPAFRGESPLYSAEGESCLVHSIIHRSAVLYVTWNARSIALAASALYFHSRDKKSSNASSFRLLSTR